MGNDSRIDHLRVDYSDRKPLERAHLAANPVDQFGSWFAEARDAGIAEPNAMTLATADGSGVVSARTVLLKAFDDSGFVFFTNYGSRKAHQIAQNPNASLLFPWVALARQVSIEGSVEKIASSESLAYFLSRPLGSRIGAWVSDQSTAIPSRALLVAKFEELKKQFASGDVPKPDGWGGYRVAPRRVEFWQGGADRLHDRFAYTRLGDRWTIERLAP